MKMSGAKVYRLENSARKGQETVVGGRKATKVCLGLEQLAILKQLEEDSL